MSGGGLDDVDYQVDKNCVEDVFDLFYTWNGSNWCWDESIVDERTFCWDDVNLIMKISGNGIPSYRKRINSLKKEEKDRFITLVCKVKGYSESREQKMKVEVNLTVDDIKLTIDEVMKSIKIAEVR